MESKHNINLCLNSLYAQPEGNSNNNWYTLDHQAYGVILALNYLGFWITSDFIFWDWALHLCKKILMIAIRQEKICEIGMI